MCALKKLEFGVLKEHAEWGEWSDWTDCAEACPVGQDLTDDDKQKRSKGCVYPEPDNKGDPCVYVDGRTIFNVYIYLDNLYQERLCSDSDCPCKYKNERYIAS